MNKLMMMVAATMVFAAFAQEPAAPAEKLVRPMRPPMMMGSGMSDPLMRALMNPAVAQKIGLSDDQKTKLAALKNDQQSDRALQEQVRAATAKQVELMKAENIDEAAVMKAIDEVFDARKEMAKSQAKRLITARSVLTPEQVAKALEAMKEFRGARIQRPKGLKAVAPASKETPTEK